MTNLTEKQSTTAHYRSGQNYPCRTDHNLRDSWLDDGQPEFEMPKTENNSANHGQPTVFQYFLTLTPETKFTRNDTTNVSTTKTSLLQIHFCLKHSTRQKRPSSDPNDGNIVQSKRVYNDNTTGTVRIGWF